MKKTFSQGDCVGKIPNAEIYWQMFKYAQIKGVYVYRDTSKADYKNYPSIVFNSNELSPNEDTYGNGVGNNWITHEQFYEYCDNWLGCQPKQVPLNNMYTATIFYSNSTVKVGCESFTFDKIEELYRAIQANKVEEQK